jgi:hypothetical protein
VFDRSFIQLWGISHPEPLCFNPTKDIISLPYDQMFPTWYEESHDGALRRHLSALSKQAAKHMDKIQHLQITSMKDHRGFWTVQELFNLNRLGDGAALQCFTGAYNSALFHFPALRKIILEILWAQRSDGDRMAIYVASVREFVELHKDKFHGGKAPEVVAIWCPHPGLEERTESLYLKMEKERVERLNIEHDS